MVIGSGIDIVEIGRIEEAFGRWGKRLLEKIFTDREIEYAGAKKMYLEHLAAHFAAKEAVFKAVGNDKLSWKDIEILNGQNGKPKCKIKPGFIETSSKVLVSISHTKDYAVANAILIDTDKR